MTQMAAVSTKVTVQSSAATQVVSHNEGREHLIIALRINGSSFWIGGSSDPSQDGVLITPDGTGALTIPSPASRAALNAVAYPGSAGNPIDVTVLEFIVQ